jgi:hypothetical protein
VLTGFAGQLEVVLRQLPRRLDRLAATGGEEHPVQIAGGVAGESLGEFDRAGRGIGPQREERQCLGLLGRGLCELLASVTDLDDE